MKKSYSRNNTRVVINHALATAGKEDIVVYWPTTEPSFIAIKQSLAVEATDENTVGVFDGWVQTSEVLDCCDKYMLKLNNKPMSWPDDVDQERLDVIAQNGNTGEHYK